MLHTLTQIIESKRQFENKGITFIEKGNEEEFISYNKLYNDALIVLTNLKEQGVIKGDELVFQIKDNKTFLTVFWACILGGIIPVPLTVALKEEHKKKIFTVWKYLKKPYLIYSEGVIDKIEEYANVNNIESIKEIKEKLISQDSLDFTFKASDVYKSSPDDIAFIQFSSGSTGIPKGVVLTHKNLVTNIAAIANAAEYKEYDKALSWMPLTHDMGMIGFHLNPLFSGMNQYLIPTQVFVRRPTIWLEKAHQYKITILCSPNFGYRYTIKNCLEVSTYNWDLKSIRILYNGAEPISEELAEEFMQKTAIYGLNKYAMRPVYGLAEASLAVSISDLLTPVSSLNISRTNLNIGSEIVYEKEVNKAIAFVNVGKVINDCDLNITNDKGEKLEEGFIGHVHIKGANVTSGYYNNPEETQKIKFEEWLRTGDIGFVVENNLYIIGRNKDILFLNGQNYYPHDIELVAQELEEIELNKIIVSGRFNAKLQREEVFAFVFHRGALKKFIGIKNKLKAHINNYFGLEFDHIIPVKDIPRTTSGKVQRYKLVNHYTEGRFNDILEQLDELVVKQAVNNIDLPKTDLEKDVYNLWVEVLEHKNFGVTDKFFDIGGNSLKAAQILASIFKEYSIELPYDIIYTKQTIKEIIELLKVEKKSVEYQEVKRVKASEFYPISSAQKQLYYIWEMDRGSTAYNIPVAIQIKGEIELSKLIESIHKIVARHEALRTIFIDRKEDGVFQKIVEEVKINIETILIKEKAIQKELIERVKPFDLHKGALIRASILKITNENHILFVDMHHSISDGVSISVFLKEIFVLYKGKGFLSLPVQYKDYIAWENKNSKKIEKQKRYWKSEFSSSIPLLNLPTDYKRPSVLDYDGRKINFQLSEELSLRLKKVAQENHVTVFTLMLSAYGILLSKLSDDEKLIVGIPVANRNHFQIQNTIGMFVNNLAIQHSIKKEFTFKEIVKNTYYKVKEGIQNQEYKFKDLVDEVEEIRDFGRNSLFDTMFMYQNMDIISDENLEIEHLFFDPKFSKYDISIEVFDQKKSITFNIEYATSLFKEATIENIADFYKKTLNEIVFNINTKVSEFTLLNQKDFVDEVFTYNKTEEDYFSDLTLHELIEKQVNRTPDKVAVFSETGELLTYKNLQIKSAQLANFLRKKGVKKEEPVAVIMDRNPKLIIAILGIMKSGGCYLPIEKDLPEARVKYILKNSSCRYLLYNSNEENLVRLDDEESLKLLDLNDLNLNKEKSVIANISRPQELAYIIYTSGTTGNPKGVMIEHKSIVNYCSWAQKMYVGNSKLNFPLYTSIAFDLTLTSIFVPLITGNTIYTYAKTFALEDVVIDNKVQCIKATPSHLKLLINLVKGENSVLSKFIVGGENFTADLAGKIKERFKENEIEIFNEYGPTEATIGCMVYKYNHNNSEGNIPIGKAIANTQIYILDSCLKPIQKGSPGEIYISGDSVARGYLYLPQLTKEKYIDNPFIQGQKMYKTGDLAKRLNTGDIEYIGRIDEQVKINGHRVEIEGIKNAIESCKGVENALIKFDEETNCLIGYVTGKEEIVSFLKTFLIKRLPNYMIPKSIIYIDEIPLTKNGKVAYNMLPKVVVENLNKNISPLSNSLESIMLQIWKKVLYQDEITIEDSFIEHGGDSIKAVQIVALLREEDIEIKVKDILNYQSISQIIANVEIKKINKNYNQNVITGDLKKTPIQKWFFNKQLQNSNYYHQSVTLKFYKPVVKEFVNQSFQKLIIHHDGLRLNYDSSKDKMYFNNTWLDYNFSINEFKVNSEDEIEVKLNEIYQSFNIENTLLIKAFLFSGLDEDLLFITAHHLIIDGFSWRVILEDFKATYTSLLNTKEVISLPLKTASLIDYENEIEKLKKTISKEEIEFWEKQESLQQTVISNNPKNLSSQTDSCSFSLDNETSMFLLKEANSVYNTTIEILLTVATIKTVTNFLGSDTVTLELEHHGRGIETIDVSRTVGWFTTLYPLSFYLGNKTLEEQIEYVKDKMRDVENGGLSYGLLKEAKFSDLNPEIRFNYLGQFEKEINNELYELVTSDLQVQSDKKNKLGVKLEINSLIKNEKLFTTISYDSKVFTKEQIQDLKSDFEASLKIILTHIKKEKTIHFTPSDFKMAGIDKTDLETLF